MTAQTLSYLMRYLTAPLLITLVWLLLREALGSLRRAMRRTIQPVRDVFLLGETAAGTGLMNLPLYAVTTVGRASVCDVRLRDESIAQRHAMIYLFDGEWFLRPLSRNAPVSINGVRIQSPTPLEDRDELLLGERSLTFLYAPEYTRLMAERDAWADLAASQAGADGMAEARRVPGPKPAAASLHRIFGREEPAWEIRDAGRWQEAGTNDAHAENGADDGSAGAAGRRGGFFAAGADADDGMPDDQPYPPNPVQPPLSPLSPLPAIAPAVQRLPAAAWLLFDLLLIGGLGISLLLIPDSLSVITHAVALWYAGFFLIANLYLIVLPHLFKGLDPVLLLCFLVLALIGLAVQTRLAIPESLVVREAIFSKDWTRRLSGDLQTIIQTAGALFGGKPPAPEPGVSAELAERIADIFASLNAQYLSIAIGILLIPLTALFVARTRLVELFIPLCAILTPLLLLATLALGNGADSHGATLWINVGGFSMQLTEFAKITYLVVLAGFFKNRPSRRMQLFFAAWAGLVFFLIMLLPDLGSAMILLPTTLLVYFVMTSEYITTLVLLAGGTGVGMVAYAIFPHVQRRIIGWTTLWTQVNDSNRQIVYGLQAMVRGGLLGRGLGNGSPGGIPLASSDMIFSVVCEELGLITGLVIVLLFIIIWLRATTVMVLAPDGFRSGLALAIGTMLFVEAVVVIAGTTGLMPLTGATLPLIAKGGSSALAKLLLVGILLGLSARPRERRVRA